MSDSKQPAFHVFVVEENKTEGGKDYYHKIGAAWWIKDGKALSVHMAATPVNGQVVLWPPKDKEDDQ